MKKILYTFLIAIGLAATNSCSDDSFPVPPASTVPKFSFVVTNDSFAPATVTFKNESIVPERAGSVAYTWNFGDGTSSTEASPVHEYDAPGAYQVNMVVVTTGSYEINDVTQTIVVKDPNATGTSVYFTNGTGVYNTLINSGSPVVEQVTGIVLTESYGMVVDTVHNKLYMADYGASKIYISDLDGKNLAEFRTDIGDPDALVIDYDNDEIYWDTADGIRKADLNKPTELSQFVDVVTGQSKDPEGFALDPVNRVIYWNCYYGGVWKKNLDAAGGEIKIIDTEGGGAMLLVNDRIYYDETIVASDDQTLRSAKTDGSDVATVATSIVSVVYGLAYDPHEDKLYWGDRNAKTIVRASPNGDNPEIWVSGYSPRGISLGKHK
jgi:PKD repeat protein